MDNKLEPCPFCGGGAVLCNEHKTDATCGNEDCVCTAAMPVEQWNTRPYLQELRACNDEYEALETENQAYEECMEDHRRLVREIDVIINGETGAAKQASLCDLVGQIKELVERRCDICGDVHEPDNIPRECETGDGF